MLPSVDLSTYQSRHSNKLTAQGVDITSINLHSQQPADSMSPLQLSSPVAGQSAPLYPPLMGAAPGITTAEPQGEPDLQLVYKQAGPVVQEQQQQQLGQGAMSPEISTAASSAVQGASAGLALSSHASPQLSGICSAGDYQHSAGGADLAMNANPQGSENLDLSGSKQCLPVVHLKVACGDMCGTLLVHKGKIVMYEGTSDEKEVSPTEFERLGGRSATKKWKQSIRLVTDDGEQGRPVGEWYVMQGLEQPKKPREVKDPSLGNSAGSASPTLDHHDTRHTAISSVLESAAPHKRPVRSTRGHVPAKHVTAAEVAVAPAAPTGRASGRRGHNTRSTAASKEHALEDSGSGTGGSPDVAAAVAAVAAAPTAVSQDLPWVSQQQLQQQVLAPDVPQYKQHQQQGTMAWDGQSGATSAADPATIASTGVAGHDAADINMDFMALGDWQLPTGAGLSAPGPSGLLVQVPVSAPLPGDATQAVVEMTAYLEGRRSIPPWRLLPPAQRPLVGRLLVPLRQLFVMVLQAGGYVRIKDDLLIWQDMATQLGLPAWPCPDVPDPLRVLQQVYRDYLLRFEGRLSLVGRPDPTQAAPAAGVGGVGACGVVQPSLPFSAAAQYASQVPTQLLGVAPGAASCTPVGAMADTNNFNMGVALENPAMQQQQRQPQPQPQQAQPQYNNSLPAIAAGMLLDGGLSGDLLDFLTDLIPDSDNVEAEQEQQQQVLGMIQPAAPASTTAKDSLAGSAHAADAARQHPEMARVQQRQRLHQLQQQLQQIQQASDGSGAAGDQGQLLGADATDISGSMAAAVAGESGRSKRPAPLIRCGDSDLVSLMDQTEVAKLLQEYEVQQQRRQLSAVRRANPQSLASMLNQPQQVAPPQNPSSSQLAAAIVGAVDRNMSQDLHAIMQQFYNQQQQQAQQLQQRGQQAAADDEMSGMLEALQLAGEAAHQQYEGCTPQAAASGTQQASVCAAAGVPAAVNTPEQLVIGPDGNNSWPGKLWGQASVGAHLLRQAVGGSSSSHNLQPTNASQSPGGVAAAGPGAAAAVTGGGTGLPPLPRPGSSSVMAPPAPRQPATDQLQPQQQQSGVDDVLLPGYKDSLLRLTTPTSALLGSVLDSPTLRSHPSGQGWMDLSGLLSGDFKSMAAELTSGDEQQQTGEEGGQDDLAAVLRMW